MNDSTTPSAPMPWLSQAEIDDLCMPLKQHAAQIRFMEGLGLRVRRKPNGAPLVMRADVEAINQDPKKKDERRHGTPWLNIEAILNMPTRSRPAEPSCQALRDRFAAKKRTPTA